ncbi:MAG: hypothetical protein H8E71_07265 [Candidatus Marinimicrobia bacterium]|nr:hypothetical protein [Candidatus Neomarinimicrobiota bacterium]MBL7108996.1 hypothetical protein [Candidatus Neomarinimicrobiota bacterium]
MSKIKTELYPQSIRKGDAAGLAKKKAKKSLWLELFSGVTGLILAGFILGHFVLESTMLFGDETYGAVAYFMEHTLPIAQVAIFVVTILFFIHFITASRKIPGKLEDRKRMLELGKNLKNSTQKWNQNPKDYTALKKHLVTELWIWQVRTGMIILALGSFHLFLVLWNIFSKYEFMGFIKEYGLTGEVAHGRVESGLWILYLVLGISVVLHLSVGLYRLAVKWFADTWFTRKKAFVISSLIFWFYLLLNIAGVMALAGVPFFHGLFGELFGGAV